MSVLTDGPVGTERKVCRVSSLAVLMCVGTLAASRGEYKYGAARKHRQFEDFCSLGWMRASTWSQGGEASPRGASVAGGARKVRRPGSCLCRTGQLAAVGGLGFKINVPVSAEDWSTAF